MFQFLKKFFGSAHDRLLKKYTKLIPLINEWESTYQKLTDEEFSQKTSEFKQRIQNGESVDQLLPEAYAAVKNACRRLCGTEIDISGYRQKWDMIPYDVQLLGAIAMHYGAIAEMQTGEGKTLTASLPLYLNALTGKSVHLVTVNDYLAKRDCAWMGSIFQKLQLNVAFLTNDIPPHERKKIYESDIVYGTASEFGFDYLRDNSIATSKEEQCQRKPFYFAIIDEVDSILIDEARTPLIISGPSSTSRQMYDSLKDGVAQLVRMQRDLCNLYASDAKRILETLELFQDGPKKKLSKEESEKEDIAFKKLWLVTKGTPQNKILKRVKEDPDLRAILDKWETYYFSEQNKAEKAEALANLFIIVDERANEYELTDKGIHAWAEIYKQDTTSNDFVMLDLGDEYAKIDSNASLSEQEKMEHKIKVCEEDALRKERAHNLRQLFRGHLLMERDVDYIVQDNKIIIIDENTGRPQPGRRFSDGLHQALEAKESVAIQQETQTYATITLQNYFRMYEKLAGMTGTAITEAAEFKEIYNLDVLEIPTYCPCKRVDHDDEIYMTEREKYVAILNEIRQAHEKGRPILIGTESVEVSEKLSRILKQAKLPYTILNAKHNEKEAEIISEAGKKGAITISTNMAGRGTDIKLSKEVAQTGGLYVIGTTRHHSRRIDRQLRGRSGRLGDPGSSKFFVSFEDTLLRLFTSSRLTAMLQRFRPPEGEPISAKIMNRSIETAQKRVEQRHYMIRKHTLEYDDVMNKQRKEIYEFRNDLLTSDNSIQVAEEVLQDVCSLYADDFLINREAESNWNPEGYRQWLMMHFPVTFDKGIFDSDYLQKEEIEKQAFEKILTTFTQKLEHQKILLSAMHTERILPMPPEKILLEILRNLMIRKIDQQWQDHLLSIDHLRAEIQLRSVGQKDPLLEFKHEAFHLFESFSKKVKLEIARDLFKFEIIQPQSRIEEPSRPLQMDTSRSFLPEQDEILEEKAANAESAPEEPAKSSPIVSTAPKIERNANCPCGSGKKYKKCCGALVSEKL